MKVLYLAAAPHIAGGNRFLLNLFDATKAQGVESILVVPDTGDMETEAKKQGITVEVLSSVQPSIKSPLKSFNGLRNWKKMIRRHKPDLIHANDFWTARSISKAADTLSIPLIVHVHFKQNSDFCKWVFNRLPSPKAFIFCSNATKEGTGPKLSKYYPTAKQHVVYNSVDTDKFKPKYSDQNHHISKVGMISNIIPRKKVVDFVDVARKVCESYPSLQFEVIGAELDEGKDYAQAVKNKIKDYGLENNFHLLGFQSNVAQFIENWDVAFCCAEHEELPISLIEASSSGLPLISTNVGGIGEIIDEGGSGFMVSVGETDKMASRLITLIENTALYKTMSENARISAQNKFHPSSTSEEILAIYKD